MSHPPSRKKAAIVHMIARYEDSPNYNQASKDLGHSDVTLKKWFVQYQKGELTFYSPITKQEIERYREKNWEKAKDRVAQKFWKVTEDLVDQLQTRIDSGEVDAIQCARSLRDLSIATGTFLDKTRELKGEPTGRVQHNVSGKIEHRHAVIVLPPVQTIDSEEDAVRLWDQMQNRPGELPGPGASGE